MLEVGVKIALEADLLHHPSRLVVDRGRERDHLLEGQVVERVTQAFGCRLRRVPMAPELGPDAPADLDAVAKPGHGQSGETDRLTGEVHAPEPEGVLAETLLDAVHECVGVGTRHHRADRGHDRRIAVEMVELGTVGLTPPAQQQPPRPQLNHWTTLRGRERAPASEWPATVCVAGERRERSRADPGQRLEDRRRGDTRDDLDTVAAVEYERQPVTRLLVVAHQFDETLGGDSGGE